MPPASKGRSICCGAKLDDLVLKDYHEEISPNSPLVRLLEPRSQEHPYYIQYGWTAPAGVTVKLPDNDTIWTASAETLTPGQAGHAVMGQRRRADVPDRPVDR